MLVNLGEYLKQHAGQPRLVAWPRVKTEMSRETLYAKLAGLRGIFAEGVKESLREGAAYSLRTSSGETWSGRVEFVSPPRGFCITVESLNNTLAWLSIEGSGQKCEAQLWFSTYGLPPERVGQIEYAWEAELHRILA